jgi:hypothetical protein
LALVLAGRAAETVAPVALVVIQLLAQVFIPQMAEALVEAGLPLQRGGRQVEPTSTSLAEVAPAALIIHLLHIYPAELEGRQLLAAAAKPVMYQRDRLDMLMAAAAAAAH